LVLPPGCLIGSGVVLLLTLKKRRRGAHAALFALFGFFYLLSIPLVSMALTKSTQELPARTLDEVREFNPEAIVVLGSGAHRRAPEYGGESVVSAATYKRLAYGAYLCRGLGELPILVSGGYGETLQESEGFVAAKALQGWGVEEVWVETEAENTRQNAVYSKDLADRWGARRVALVTSASHAPRAAEEFRKVGFEVLACPTGFRTSSAWEHGIFLVVPTHHHFDESCYALRTHLGRVWYRLR
jgi:uncharacterized SAM-binding protein YcdF (DUF218 family)